jgi:hypothetical protein
MDDDTPAGWPKGVRVLAWEDTGDIGVDGAGNLYYQGKKLQTVGELRLTRLQAWIAGATAVIATGAAVVQAWAAVQAL